MKKLLILILLPLFLISSSIVLAQPMMEEQIQTAAADHTAREEKEGKEIWEKLQAKQLGCKDLTDDNFDSLGEYFMGQMAGDTKRHELMNQMMMGMMGETGEEQMHEVLGKRMSGCDTSATVSSSSTGFLPMMNMMMGGGGNPMMGFGNAMGWSGGWGLFGSLFWLFWVVALVDLILLGIWLWKQIKKK